MKLYAKRGITKRGGIFEMKLYAKRGIFQMKLDAKRGTTKRGWGAYFR